MKCSKEHVNWLDLELYIHVSVFIGGFLYGGDGEQKSMDTAQKPKHKHVMSLWCLAQ